MCSPSESCLEELEVRLPLAFRCYVETALTTISLRANFHDDTCGNSYKPGTQFCYTGSHSVQQRDGDLKYRVHLRGIHSGITSAAQLYVAKKRCGFHAQLGSDESHNHGILSGMSGEIHVTSITE